MEDEEWRTIDSQVTEAADIAIKAARYCTLITGQVAAGRYQTAAEAEAALDGAQANYQEHVSYYENLKTVP